MGSPTETSERRQYLAFSFAGGDYAVGILKVKEILQYDEITRVPSTPRWIRGVLNLRGSVVPVVDLAVKFGLREGAVTNRTCVLVVETVLDGSSIVMGLVADAVSEVIELAADDIEETPAFGTHVKEEHDGLPWRPAAPRIPVLPAPHVAPAPAVHVPLPHPVAAKPTKPNGASGDHGFKRF